MTTMSLREKLEDLYRSAFLNGVDRRKDMEVWTAELKVLIEAEVRAAETNTVAWTVGVIDELHINSNSSFSDPVYKGVKNTLRDRYKAETGIDPAPHYPIHAQLSTPSPRTGYELHHCLRCYQMTNHLNGVCQKCKIGTEGGDDDS